MIAVKTHSMFLRILCAFVLGVLFPVSAFATDQLDIVSGLNTLSQLINKINGGTTMAIVYDPANAASKADADTIKKLVDAGITMPGGGALSAILVGVGEPGKLSRARIAFLTPGLSAYYDNINNSTSAASIITMTTDIDCVRAGKCIIGIVSNPPSLTIYYSKQAADNAKIEFSQAFSMLVKQP